MPCGGHYCGWAVLRNTEVPLRNRRQLHIDDVTSTMVRDWLMRIRHIVTALEPDIPVQKGLGSHVHFSPRPCSSTYGWAKHSTHRHKKTTLGMDISTGHNAALVLSCPFYSYSRRMRASAKGLGCLLKLAHAAGHETSPCTAILAS